MPEITRKRRDNETAKPLAKDFNKNKKQIKLMRLLSLLERYQQHMKQRSWKLPHGNHIKQMDEKTS
ncbi:CLUMA_CG010262, isoform A [Clunio marinus]|uniref:CLUMA_CG010262, isoform A n=1 Tax=Clunio marinus TaxID=568069 RepID=A0A1J1IDK0_9DIPT|nr:CLUMA_CG010262, isoform A [Clunio marinus]